MEASTPQGVRAALEPTSEGVCPSCGGHDLEVFHEQRGVPVISNRLFATRAEAVGCERGDLRLAFCHECGLITNIAFTVPTLTDDYESSQASSAVFRDYATALAGEWVSRRDLTGATVLEIGCARGEFLAWMTEITGGYGIGVDPVLAHPGSSPVPAERVTWVAERFRAEHLTPEVRAIVCRHTLEHVPEIGAFLREIRDAIGGDEEPPPLLMEVPDALPILQAGAFWDLYYEHCTYLTVGSLRRVLAQAGFAMTSAEHTYGGQYLVAEADAVPPGMLDAELAAEDDRALVRHAATAFAREYARRTEALHAIFEDLEESGQRVAFWGAGSKATAYLTALGLGEEVACVVDINRRKQGSFIPGTGHAVVAPEALREVRPDVVVMMNPIYRGEIEQMLGDLGVAARLVDPA